MGRFENTVAIITGSSIGIGRATAVLFAKEGAKVTIHGRDAGRLTETNNECIKAGAKPENIHQVLGEITCPEVQSKLLTETKAKFGKITTFVANHGAAQPGFEGDKDPTNVKHFDSTFDTNLKSVYALVELVVPYLKETKGDIVLVSTVGTVLNSGNLFYGLAKCGVNHLTRIAAIKYAKDGIRVNCVNPGMIHTNFMIRLGYTEEEVLQRQEKRKPAIPIGRPGQPEEIATVIAFLADRTMSSYITAQCIFADGGLTQNYAANMIQF